MSEDKLYISWEEFYLIVDKLCDSIPDGKYTAILAISAGGLIPAYFIAKKKGIKVVETLCLESYQGRKQSSGVQRHMHRKMTKNFERPLPDVLCVDDIVDSGKTMQLVREIIPNIHIATVFKKECSVIQPQYCVEATDKWVEFPWEYKDSLLSS